MGKSVWYTAYKALRNHVKPLFKEHCSMNLQPFFIIFLSYYNPCFESNIAITNFLVSRTCQIRFNDVKGSLNNIFQDSLVNS